MTEKYYIIALRQQDRPTLYVNHADTSRGIAGLTVSYSGCIDKRDRALKMNMWSALKIAALCNIEADQILAEQGIATARAYIEDET